VLPCTPRSVDYALEGGVSVCMEFRGRKIVWKSSPLGGGRRQRTDGGKTSIQVAVPKRYKRGIANSDESQFFLSRGRKKKKRREKRE